VNYDTWKSTEPDPCPEGRREIGERACRCRDCAGEIFEGGHGAPLVQAVYCDACWRWRTARGLEFDTRSKAQIASAA
jgi:hypothetical protein